MNRLLVLASLLALLLAALSWASLASAAPVAVLTEAGIQITLYDDKCQIPAPKNLVYRAVWTEGAKKFEGCFTVFMGQFIGAYFNDSTMAVVPAQLFKPVQSI